MGLIYLDSCLLIYLVENHPNWAQKISLKMSLYQPEGFAISSLVKLECLVKPLKEGDLALQKRYELAFDHVTLLELSDAVFLQAAQLRSRFGLKTPDALHLACAQHHGCQAIWTNDDRLAQASHGLAQSFLEN